MKEKESVENKIKKYLDIYHKNDVWYFKHAASAAMPVGIPDLICCIKGHFVGIETKRADGVQSKRQKVCGKNITDTGGQYWLAFSFEQFLIQFNDFMEKIENGTKT